MVLEIHIGGRCSYHAYPSDGLISKGKMFEIKMVAL